MRATRWALVCVWVAVAGVLGLGGGRALGQGEGTGIVELRASIRAARGATLTLADVARLEGADACALGGVVVAPSVQGRSAADLTARLTLEDVRGALEPLHINWGRLVLRGSFCVVRFTEAPTPAVEPAPVGAREPATVDLDGPETVRARVARLVGRMLGVENKDLRLLFDRADGEFLGAAVGERRVEVQPASSPSSGHLALVVWIYEGDRLVESRTVKAAAQVRREVVVVTQDVERGSAMPREHLRVETLWLEAGGSAPVSSLEHAAGLHARRRLAAGTALRMDVVEAPLAIRRGELVTVHCVSGGVVVKAIGRAQADAREGEYVDLLLEGAAQTFRARAAGQGRAVLLLDR